MVRWSEFEAAAPAMAQTGQAMFYQFGIGLGFLATVRRDGGPRMHPFCPIITGGGLYGLIGDSPKRLDLVRDGRVAIHSFPRPELDDEFYIAGTARRVYDPAVYRAVLEAYQTTGGLDDGTTLLFEFDIERVMLAKYEPRPQWPPVYSKWAAP